MSGPNARPILLSLDRGRAPSEAVYLINGEAVPEAEWWAVARRFPRLIAYAAPPPAKEGGCTRSRLLC